MNKSFSQKFACACIALSTTFPCVVSAVSLDISETEGFNLVTWEGAQLINSDTEGRVAVGGDAYFQSYSIGNQADGIDLSKGSFVVGGNLDWTGGSVSNGSVYVGGNVSGPNYNLNSSYGSTLQGNLGSGNVPYDFVAARQSLTAKSLAWGLEAATGTSVLQWSTLTLSGSEEGVNVFTIDAAMLAAASTLNIFVPESAKVLINVTGVAADFSNMGLGGTFTAESTLFNFFEAEDLQMSGIGVIGSILAPLADVQFISGQMNGQLIAKSFYGASWGVGEMHDYAFENDETVADVRVPDSGSTLLLGLISIAAFIGIRMKTRRAA